MAAAQTAEIHEDKWGLSWYWLWGICTSVPAWAHSKNTLASAEAPSLKTSSNGTFLNWSQIPSQSAQE